MEMEGNDTATNIGISMPNMVQPKSYTNLENNESMKQKGDRLKDIQEWSEQTKTWETVTATRSGRKSK